MDVDFHSRFKSYCAVNDTTMTAVLESHIDSLLYEYVPAEEPYVLVCRSGCGKSNFYDTQRRDEHEKTCLGSDDLNNLHKKWSSKNRHTARYPRHDRLGNRIHFSLTFDEYKGLLDDAGITVNDIGSGLRNFCLGRIDDLGDYDVGNCRFITNAQNLYEASLHSYAALQLFLSAVPPAPDAAHEHK